MAHSPATTTRKLCERAFKVHGDARYERLTGISNGHLYNLRQHQAYLSKCGSFDKTRPAKVNIGERRKPFLGGCPGYLRADSFIIDLERLHRAGDNVKLAGIGCWCGFQTSKKPDKLLDKIQCVSHSYLE
ncbi:MAG: hypothetical protein EPN14_10785 [Gallionella sp.]|nr:MAG: hypothetical protein EPN14_10785 [Gallionella sp.]